MKSRSIFTVILVVLFSFLITGCGFMKSIAESSGKNENTASDQMSEQKENKNVVLNERQKEILRDSGLPENYDELEPKQQYAIKAIEEMLVHTEEKYGKTFCYNGYVPSGVLEDEQLICYEEGTLPEREIIVTREYENDEAVYTDNYPETEAGEKYAEQLSEKLSDLIGENDFLLISQITELPEGTADDHLLDEAAALTRVFVSSENCGKEQHEETAEKIYRYLSDDMKGFAGEVWYYLVDKDTFSMLTPYNCKDVLSEYGFEDIHTIKVSRTGRNSIELHH